MGKTYKKIVETYSLQLYRCLAEDAEMGGEGDLQKMVGTYKTEESHESIFIHNQIASGVSITELLLFVSAIQPSMVAQATRPKEKPTAYREKIRHGSDGTIPIQQQTTTKRNTNATTCHRIRVWWCAVGKLVISRQSTAQIKTCTSLRDLAQ